MRHGDLLVPLLAVLVSSMIAYFSARRSAYERVTALMQEMSTGEVAQARHILGTLATNTGMPPKEALKAALSETPEDQRRNEAIRNLFIMCWALDRVRAQAMSFVTPGTGPETVMMRALGPWLVWWTNGHLDDTIKLLNDPEVMSRGSGPVQIEEEQERVESLNKRWQHLQDRDRPAIAPPAPFVGEASPPSVSPAGTGPVWQSEPRATRPAPTAGDEQEHP